MAGDLGWKSVELQIETLIPGVLLIAEIRVIQLRWFVSAPSVQTWLPRNDFIRGATFVAVAYAIGLVSSMVARALVDGISERGPRAWAFTVFAHAKIEDLVKERARADSLRFPQDLQEEESRRSNPMAAAWNATYRSAVRTTSRREEVDRRRSQGRFVRNLFFVLLLAPTAAFQNVIVIAALSVLAFGLGIALYAYAEYVIFAEAFDISALQSPPSVAA